MLKEILCFLAFDDAIGAKKKFAYFCSEDPTLDSNREGEFLNGMIAAKEENNLESFNKTLKTHT